MKRGLREFGEKIRRIRIGACELYGTWLGGAAMVDGSWGKTKSMVHQLSIKINNVVLGRSIIFCFLSLLLFFVGVGPHY